MKTDVRFGILGPVRANNPTADLEIGGRQQQVVLALLLARAGGIVGLAEFVDALWAHEPPPSAVNSIHRAVGVLRRILQPDLPVRASGRYLVRQASGYRLPVDEDSLDLLRFRAQTRRARHAGGDVEAVHHYAAALSLWQGPCGAGLDMHPAFVALDAELSRAACDAADAALRCGLSHRLLPDLIRIGGWHQFDEALQARIVLALAAEGRSADALESFAGVRRRLAEELGLNPGRELLAAHRHVLRQGPAGARSPQVIAARLPSPAQLPTDHPYYAGRADILRQAEALLSDDRAHGRATVALAFDGAPGIGKTTVAVHLAHRLVPAYPGGQLYVDLRGSAEPITTHEALRGLLSSLGVGVADQPPDLQAAAGIYRSLIAGRRMVVVLDDCRDHEQVRHLLPGTRDSLALVTSRSRLIGLLAAGAHPVPLRLPSSDEAHEHLVRRLGQARAGAEPTAARRLVELCGRHPLAVGVIAAYASCHPQLALADLARELNDVREQLRAQHRHESVDRPLLPTG